MDSSSLLEVLQLSGHPLGMLGNVLGEDERHSAVILLST